jgi:hypothetical protein
MPTMNEGEIDQALYLIDAAPEYRRYVQYLKDWVEIVNHNSDGWAYWRIASRAANRLQDLTAQLVEWIRYGGDAPHRLPQPAKPTLAAFSASLRPIKAFATRQKLPAPMLREEAQQA